MAKKSKPEDGRSYRLQVRLPEEWRAAVEQAAQAEGLSASDWTRDAMLKKLPKAVRDSLPDVSRGRPAS